MDIDLNKLTVGNIIKKEDIKFLAIYLQGKGIKIFYSDMGEGFKELTEISETNIAKLDNDLLFLDSLLNTVNYGQGKLLANVQRAYKHIEALILTVSGQDVFRELLEDLKEVKFYDLEAIKNEELTLSSQRYISYRDSNNYLAIKKYITDYYRERNNLDLEEVKQNIVSLAESGRDIRKLHMELYKFLLLKNFILRANTLEYYVQDGYGYSHIEEQEVHRFIKENVTPYICEKDVSKGVKEFFDRKKPTYNCIKFRNGIYNLNTMEFTDFKDFKDIEEPILTSVVLNYNYNPNAESTYIKQFLESSLKKTDPAETEKCIAGLYELIGYLFTAGNTRQKLIILCGTSGGGKSVLGNLITAIFGLEAVADMKLSEPNQNSHATAQLLNKNINLVKDSDSRPITNVGLIKQITGNEPLATNPKGRDAVTIPKEEIPKMILVCNQLPVFKPTDPALVERLCILEFSNKIRGTKNEIHNLEELILKDNQEIEFLIYQGLEHYRQLVNKGKGADFILSVGANETRNLIQKHTSPLDYLMEEVLLKFDPPAYICEANDPLHEDGGSEVYYDDLNKVLLRKAKIEGLDLITNKNGDLTSKAILDSMKRVLNLDGELDFQTDLEREPIYKKFTSKRKTLLGRKRTYYPYIVVKNSYRELLTEIREEEKEKGKRTL